MRPQIVSRTRKHYDGLIRAIEAEGLAVLPAISTLMDNREACAKFFVEEAESKEGRRQKAEGSKQKAVKTKRGLALFRAAYCLPLTAHCLPPSPLYALPESFSCSGLLATVSHDIV